LKKEFVPNVHDDIKQFFRDQEVQKLAKLSNKILAEAKARREIKLKKSYLDVKEVVGEGEAKDSDSFVSWVDSDPDINHLFSVLRMDDGFDVENLEMGKKGRMLVISDIKEQNKVFGFEDEDALF
ncbi:hypothetical protein Tco_0871622, partial [Tanacetum coccineum]